MRALSYVVAYGGWAEKTDNNLWDPIADIFLPVHLKLLLRHTYALSRGLIVIGRNTAISVHTLDLPANGLPPSGPVMRLQGNKSSRQSGDVIGRS